MNGITDWIKKYPIAAMITFAILGAVFLAGPVALAIYSVKRWMGAKALPAAKGGTTAEATAAAANK